MTAGNNISISYSGATTGENEYVSAIIVDESDNVLYYGRIVDMSSSTTGSGTTDITIPTAMPSGNYTIKVFSEQYNGDRMTDYVSNLVDIPVTVTETAAKEYTVFCGSEGDGSLMASPARAFPGTRIMLVANPQKGWKFKEWKVVSGGVTIVYDSFIMPETDVNIRAVFEEISGTHEPVDDLQAGPSVLTPVMTLVAREEENRLLSEALKHRVTMAYTVYYGNDDNKKWYVIGQDGTGAVQMNGTVTLFLVEPFESVKFREENHLPKENQYNYYGKAEGSGESKLKTVLDGYYTSLFSEVEQSAIKSRTLTHGELSEDPNSLNDGIVDTDPVEAYLWPLSAKEVDQMGREYCAFNDYNATFWRLRSGGFGNLTSYCYNLGVCFKNGNKNLINLGVSRFSSEAVRPAFNLDASSVVLTSPAEGGKPLGIAPVLTHVSNYSGNEWKLTIVDPSRNNFTASRTGSGIVSAGDSISINYSGAKTGENEYVSAVILDQSGRVLYYGHIASGSQSGTAEIQIPYGLPNGDCTIKVFSEQCNGDKKTDYASNLAEVRVQISGGKGYTVMCADDGYGTAIARPAAAVAGTRINLMATEKQGYQFKEWQVVSGDVTITDNSFIMPEGNVEVKAVFEEQRPPKHSITVLQGDGFQQSPNGRIWVFSGGAPEDDGVTDGGVTMAAPGEEITLRYNQKRSDQYSFGYWEVLSGDVTFSGDVTAREYSFIMPDTNVVIRAVIPNTDTYFITVTTDGNGRAESVYPYQLKGEKVSLYQTPNPGYVFKEWQVLSNNTTVGGDNKFTMPAGDVEIKAIFEEIASATDYEGTYDGQAHGITVTVTDKVNATVKYGTSEGNYDLDESPTYTGASESPYTVYYKVSAENITDIIGSATVRINKAPLTVKANEKTISYGDAPANDGVSYSGFVNGETESVLSGSIGFDYTYTQYGDTGSYTITPKGLTSDNYAISFDPGVLTVEKKEVGLAWSATPFTFNGSAQAPTATATGLVNSDDISVTVTGAQTDAGTGYIATASGLTGSRAGSYKLPDEKTKTFSIAKAGARSVSDITQNKVYLTTGITASVAGKMPADAGTVTFTKGSESKTGNVAISSWSVDSSTGAVTATISGGRPGDTITLPIRISSTNYEDSTVNVKVTLVDKSDAGVTITEGSDKSVDFGDDNIQFHATAVTEGTNGAWTWMSSNTSVATVTDDGTVTIVGGGQTSITASYDSDTTTGQTSLLLTVNPKSVTIPTAFTGLRYTGDELTGVAAGPEYTVMNGKGTAAGSYTATATLISTINYKWSDGTTEAQAISWSIDKASITLSLSQVGWVKGESPKTSILIGNVGNGAVTYEYKKQSEADTAYSDAVPDEPGDYVVRATVAETDNYVGGQATARFIITEHMVACELITPPAAISDLVYTGNPMRLVAPGVASGGAIKYSLTETGTYTEDIPTGMDAGDYTVYYKLISNEGNKTVTESSIPVSIAQKDLVLSLVQDGWVKGRTTSDPVLRGNEGNGAVTYAYKRQSENDAAYVSSVPSEVGNYVVRATVSQTQNYTGGTATAEFRITAPEPKPNPNPTPNPDPTPAPAPAPVYSPEEPKQVEEKDEGLTTTTEVKNPDGSISEISVTKLTDGSVTRETVRDKEGNVEYEYTRTKDNGTTLVQTINERADGSKKETSVTTTKSGTVSTKVKEQTADGTVISGEGKSYADGRTSLKEAKTDSDGVTKVVTEKADATGNGVKAEYTAIAGASGADASGTGSDDQGNKTSQKGTNISLTTAEVTGTTLKLPDEIWVNEQYYVITEIGKNALRNNKTVTKLTIGENVTKIGSSAFRNITNLKKVTINAANLQSIGKNAFKGVGDKKRVTVTIKGVTEEEFEKICEMFRKAGIGKKVKFVMG